jgi:hypothetical protein
VRARPQDKPVFTAFCYPGFLPGNAFGFNEAGICFSCNNVQPLRARDGVGRHFIPRSLLESRSLPEAIAAVHPPDPFVTLATALFDLQGRKLTLYGGSTRGADARLKPLVELSPDFSTEPQH